MSNVFNVVSRLFNTIFVDQGGNYSYFVRLIRLIIYGSNGYLIVGTVLLIIGFSIGIIKRIIHS